MHLMLFASYETNQPGWFK